MTRSKKKLPYVNPKLMEKIRKIKSKAQERSLANGTPIIMPPIKTYARNSTIVDGMVGLEFQVHNGKNFIPVKIFDSLIGHKLGEFSPTRVFKGHPDLKKQKEVTNKKNEKK
jgi:small subunit ribosomal protein S19